MITLEETSLYNEVLAVRQQGAKPVTFYWTVEIHTPTADYSAAKKVLTVMEVDISRDYEKNIGDETTIKLQIPMGFWAKVLYPARSELEISIFKNAIGETAGVKENSPIQATRYKASPVLEGLPVIQGKDVDMIGEETLNLRGLLTVSFQLISKTVDQLRMITVGGIYRDCTGQDVIKGMLTAESKKAIVDSGAAIEAVDMVPATNTTKRNHVVLPHGLKLTDLAHYVQEACGGVYSAAINAYIQDKVWYVYPLYDNTRLQTAAATITMIKVPNTLSQGSERTYRQNGEDTIILATSDSDFADDAGTNYLNDGNGVRFVDANRYLNGSLVETKGNKAVALRGQLVNEVVTSQQSNRNNVQSSDRKISANPYREYSKMAARNGANYVFHWDNANPDLLRPGMMVKILYLSGENIEEVTGVLLRTHTLVQLAGANLQSKRHVCTTVCGVFVNKAPTTDT